MFRSNARFRAYREGGWKLVESSDGQSFLFDLASDPGETHSLASERPQQLARLRAQLEDVRWRLGLPALDGAFAAGDAAPALDEATQQRLRELGYLE